MLEAGGGASMAALTALAAGLFSKSQCTGLSLNKSAENFQVKSTMNALNDLGVFVHLFYAKIPS